VIAVDELDTAVVETPQLEQFRTRFPMRTLADVAAIHAQHPDATDVRPWIAWQRAGRQVRHGQHGIVLPQVTTKPRARVFDVDQTEPAPQTSRPARAGYSDIVPIGGAYTMPAANPAKPPDDLPDLATCSYKEFLPEYGVPVRFTAGYPRFLRLEYKIAGHAKLITPLRTFLDLPYDAYRVAYLRHVESAGVTAIAVELRAIAPTGRIVLLCFEDLGNPKKPDLWCHRSMFADFWQRKTGREVPELGRTHGHAATPAKLPDPTLF
jgi:hypothetical protein